MAALVGFDSFVGSAVLTPPYLLASTLASVVLPVRTTVGGIDIDVDDLDSNAAPTIALNVGDVTDVDRFVALDTTARAGGLLEYRPAATTWFRYPLGGTVNVTVGTVAATAVAGSIGITIYGYPSVDVSDIARATLQRMGVLAEGETPRFDDNAVTLEALAEVHEMLRGRRLANKQDLAWPLAAVPLFALRPYAAIAANMLADTFGLSAQRIQLMAQRAAEGERELRRQTQVPYSGKPVSLEPYRDPATFVLDYGELL
jgi:hypothetical protein